MRNYKSAAVYWARVALDARAHGIGYREAAERAHNAMRVYLGDWPIPAAPVPLARK